MPQKGRRGSKTKQRRAAEAGGKRNPRNLTPPRCPTSGEASTNCVREGVEEKVAGSPPPASPLPVNPRRTQNEWVMRGLHDDPTNVGGKDHPANLGMGMRQAGFPV